MNDPFTSQPEFHIAVTGGNVEENNQLTTAIYHSLMMCGFTGLVADPMTTLTPGPVASADVLNALFALNPDLFETPIMVAGVTEQDAMQNRALMLQQQAYVTQMPYLVPVQPSQPANW